jgi:hypothetical protein
MRYPRPKTLPAAAPLAHGALRGRNQHRSRRRRRRAGSVRRSRTASAPSAQRASRAREERKPSNFAAACTPTGRAPAASASCALPDKWRCCGRTGARTRARSWRDRQDQRRRRPLRCARRTNRRSSITTWRLPALGSRLGDARSPWRSAAWRLAFLRAARAARFACWLSSRSRLKTSSWR